MAGLLPTLCLSQTPPAIDYAARVESVADLKEHIAQREVRFESVKKDLHALDERVEKQISDIVTRLSSLRDSNESKTRVANVKADVMHALVRTTGVYRQKRMEAFERIRKDPGAPKEMLEREIAIFDERVGKRIQQIVEIARSQPGHVDIEKYESDGGHYWRGWAVENTRISEDWKQNRRDSTSDEKIRRELVEGLDKALERNQARRASLASNLATGKQTENSKEAMEEELGRTDAIIDDLRAQKRELTLPSVGATREIGRDEARDGEAMLDDARADLARDMAEIMRKFTELDREGTNIHSLKENLKAREEWLKNNPPPAGGTPSKE
ncbi:hypothetical protein GCM10023212_36860 [Luteolibacter yonseiensis]